MNNLQLLKYFILGTLSFILLACGGEENEVEKPEENGDPIVALVFNAQNPPISIPSALLSSQNDHAIAITGFLRLANGITSYATYFNVPDDAEVSNSPIRNSENDRLAVEDVIVYKWIYNNGNQFVTRAYQLTPTDGEYLFEIFEDFGGEDGFEKILEGNESIADLMGGNLRYLGFNDSDTEINYEWSEEVPGTLIFETINYNNRIAIMRNSDNSGSLNIYSQGFKNAEYTWNLSGTAGTFATYDAQGNLVESGNWSS